MASNESTPPAAPALAPAPPGGLAGPPPGVAYDPASGILPPPIGGSVLTWGPPGSGIEERTGVVILLDALGVRGTASEDGTIAVLSRLVEVLDSANTFIQSGQFQALLLAIVGIFSNVTAKMGAQVAPPSPMVQVPSPPRVIGFGDAVLIVAAGPRPPREYLPWAGMVVGPYLAGSLTKGVLLRGAISVGRWAEYKGLVAGPAVDDAAEWYDKADWSGVLLTPSTGYGLAALEEETKHRFSDFTSWKVPFQDRKLSSGATALEMTVVDWTRSVLADREQILTAFSQRRIPIAAESKYRNTLRFLDEKEALPSAGTAPAGVA